MRLSAISHGFIVAHFYLCAGAIAQNTTEPEINTDRPTVTPSPLVVPQNYIQVENGLVLRKEFRGSSFNVPQTLVRLGVLPKTELRLVAPNYFLIKGNQSSISGTADMSVAIKQQLGPLPGNIQLAVIPGLTVPTGSAAFSTDKVDPFVQLTAAKSLSANWTLGSAQSLFVQTEEAEAQAQGISSRRKNIIYQPTCVLFRKLGPRADLFFEYAGNFARRRISDQVLDSGCVFRFRRNQQVGIRTGVGFTKASPVVFVELGYSFLLGKIIK